MDNKFPTTVYDVAVSEAQMANAEVRRLRRGIVQAMKCKSITAALYVLNELVSGEDACPLPPEWDHHREDE